MTSFQDDDITTRSESEEEGGLGSDTDDTDGTDQDTDDADSDSSDADADSTDPS